MVSRSVSGRVRKSSHPCHPGNPRFLPSPFFAESQMRRYDQKGTRAPVYFARSAVDCGTARPFPSAPDPLRLLGPRAAFNARDLRNCRAFTETPREQSGAGTEEAEGNRGGWWPGEPHRTPKRYARHMAAQNNVENGFVVWPGDTKCGVESSRLSVVIASSGRRVFANSPAGRKCAVGVRGWESSTQPSTLIT